jgi:hypothetical protein
VLQKSAAKKTVDLTQKLTCAIELTGGPRSRLVTLHDAAVLIRGVEAPKSHAMESTSDVS